MRTPRPRPTRSAIAPTRKRRTPIAAWSTSSAMLLLALTGCSTTWTTGTSSTEAGPAPVASIVNPCDAIAVPSYTREQMREASRELGPAPGNPMLRLFLRDFSTMGRAVGACHSR